MGYRLPAGRFSLAAQGRKQPRRRLNHALLVLRRVAHLEPLHLVRTRPLAVAHHTRIAHRYVHLGKPEQRFPHRNRGRPAAPGQHGSPFAPVKHNLPPRHHPQHRRAPEIPCAGKQPRLPLRLDRPRQKRQRLGRLLFERIDKILDDLRCRLPRAAPAGSRARTKRAPGSARAPRQSTAPNTPATPTASAPQTPADQGPRCTPGTSHPTPRQ